MVIGLHNVALAHLLFTFDCQFHLFLHILSKMSYISSISSISTNYSFITAHLSAFKWAWPKEIAIFAARCYASVSDDTINLINY